VQVATNVILDVLLDRRPHSKASTALCAAVEARLSEGFVAAHAVTTIHYLLSRERDNATARKAVDSLLRVFSVAAVDRSVLQDALASASADFEDAVTLAAARLAGCDLIVTRDPKGFRGARIRVLAPEAALPLLRAT
jgi:predicted nucleic acid-binding protein